MALIAKAKTPHLYYHVSGTELNLAATGSLTVLPAVSGKSFLPRAAFIRITSESANSTPPTIKVQAGGLDISLATVMGTSSHTVNDLLEIPLFPAGTHATNRLALISISSTGVVFTVTSAANGVLTGYCWIEGYII